MFSLVVTIIAIALVLLLLAATMYYGRSSMLKSGAATAATDSINRLSQVDAALSLYAADHDGALPDTVTTLVQDHYLKANPDPTITFQPDYVVRPVATQDICLDIDIKLGLTSIPSCSDPSIVGKSYCCASTQ